MWKHPHSQSQETGANRPLQPLSRVKEDGMRVLCAAVFSLAVVTAAFAGDLQIKVVDPQSAAVGGAQVSLFPKGIDTPLKIVLTTAEGIACFGSLSSGHYRVQILAPGFAPRTWDFDISPQSHAVRDQFTVQLRLAVASETVVVTATRSPVPGEDAGADVATLNSAQLTAMQPPAA